MSKIKLANDLRDEIGPLAATKDALGHQILSYFSQAGYTRITTPLVEEEALFQDYESKDRLYKFTDSNGQSLVLRPDLTLPIARYLANNNISLPRKFYYLGEVMSIGQQLTGQRNEITQAGMELVGFNSIKAEIECLLAIDWLNQTFLKSQMTIELGHALLVKKVLDQLNIDRSTKNQLASALFNKNFPRYQELLKQVPTTPYQSFLSKWPRLFGTVDEVTSQLSTVQVPKVAQPIIQQLVNLAGFVHRNCPQQSIVIDLSTAVPQKYYTGMIFKGYTSQANANVVSGGRYDKLMESFTNQALPAVGFGINLDLLAQLTPAKKTAVNTLVFSDQSNLDQAVKLVQTHQNYSLALATKLQAARAEAAQSQMKLKVIGDD